MYMTSICPDVSDLSDSREAYELPFFMVHYKKKTWDSE